MPQNQKKGTEFMKRKILTAFMAFAIATSGIAMPAELKAEEIGAKEDVSEQVDATGKCHN